MSTRSLVRPEGHPNLHYSHFSYSIKGEDVVFVYDDLQLLAPDPQSLAKWDMFCICDGHGGPEAAEFAKTNLPAFIVTGLPKGPPPEAESEEGQRWLQTVRGAINNAFVQLDLEFAKQQFLPSVGCTTTVALFCGWIMTVANVGDTEACLDIGAGDPFLVTVSHKIDDNTDEQNRLLTCGKEVRPLSEELYRPARSYEEGVGPLRVWPCGLAVSRAIGDYDCGHEILASPHIIQIKIPFAGARLTIASDGLWDHLSAKRIVKRSRKHFIQDVPSQLIAKARKTSSFGLTDDTTVLVLDILPTPNTDFKAISKKIRGPRKVLSKWGRTLSRNRKKGFPSLFLASEDMAPDEPVPYPSFRSQVSVASSRDRHVEKSPVRSKTFGDVIGPSSESGSHSNEEETEKPVPLEGHSYDFDHGTPSAISLRRYRSSTLE